MKNSIHIWTHGSNSYRKRFAQSTLPVLGGLDGTGLESFDSAVTDKMNDGRFADTLVDIITKDLQQQNYSVSQVNRVFKFPINLFIQIGS